MADKAFEHRAACESPWTRCSSVKDLNEGTRQCSEPRGPCTPQTGQRTRHKQTQQSPVINVTAFFKNPPLLPHKRTALNFFSPGEESNFLFLHSTTSVQHLHNAESDSSAPLYCFFFFLFSFAAAPFVPTE